jgi:hypothetical protein
VRCTAVAPTAGLLFSVHAVHVEAVANVVGRAELLAGAAFIAATLCYARTGWQRGGRGAGPTLALAAAGMLCKEQAVTALAACVVYELLCVPPRPLVR